ncbi:hypothetical protein EOL99_04260 [Candidatus Falkowbacteria bacterium]|nr:hypothetical protein [Candidatus Falkowbacteria bacterium]
MKNKKKIVLVNDLMQKNYQYQLSAPLGKSFAPDFKPELTPKEMLSLGVFGGRYMRDCQAEFPPTWFKGAKLAIDKADKSLNYFKVKASLPLSYWQKKGWIHPDDPRGWFQWYCRYYYGRRQEEEDRRQIKRWRAMKRHVMAIKNNCRPGDITCRARQRQAVLHWAYDSRCY